MNSDQNGFCQPSIWKVKVVAGWCCVSGLKLPTSFSEFRKSLWTKKGREFFACSLWDFKCPPSRKQKDFLPMGSILLKVAVGCLVCSLRDSGSNDTQGNCSFQLMLLQAAVAIFVQGFCVPGWDNAASIFLLCLPGVYSWRVLKASPHFIYSNYWDHIWFFSLQTLPTLATVELNIALAVGKHNGQWGQFLIVCKYPDSWEDESFR